MESSNQHPADEIRNLELNAEDADLLDYMLRWIFKNHYSANIRDTAVYFLKRLEDLQTKK